MDGTTAIVVLVWREPSYDSVDNVKLLVANAGDSRAVLVQRNEFKSHHEKAEKHHQQMLDSERKLKAETEAVDSEDEPIQLNNALAVLSNIARSHPNGLDEFLADDDDISSNSKASEELRKMTASNKDVQKIQKHVKSLCNTPADTAVRSMVNGPVLGVRLSEDHKPDREDEKRRVESLGGIVQDMTGCARVFTPTPLQIGTKSVQWGLAVSRSFGDLPLKDPKHFNGPAHCLNLVSVMPEITTFDLKGGQDLALVRMD
jgi:serine/threonine protein phosphatase PrpC